jgi:hypothetical protein
LFLRRTALLAPSSHDLTGCTHHLKFAQGRALGRKVSDEYTVPLCRTHHRDLHRRGDELTWWQQLNIHPRLTASALWAQTHPAPAASEANHGKSCSAAAAAGTPARAISERKTVGAELAD